MCQGPRGCHAILLSSYTVPSRRGHPFKPLPPPPPASLWNLITLHGPGWEAGHLAQLWWQPQGCLIITRKGGARILWLFLKTKLTLIPFDTGYVQIAGAAPVVESRNLKLLIRLLLTCWVLEQVTPPPFPSLSFSVYWRVRVSRLEWTNWFCVSAKLKWLETSY